MFLEMRIPSHTLINVEHGLVLIPAGEGLRGAAGQIPDFIL